MNDGNETLPNAADIARYIEQFSRELRAMAQKANLPFLAFLLSMTEDEAGATLRRLGNPADRA